MRTTVFHADLLALQNTGYFFDQRDNRRCIAGLARGARVLDLYCDREMKIYGLTHGRSSAVAASRQSSG